MRALILKPDPQCDPGLVGDRLIERGYRLDIHAIVPPERSETPSVAWRPPDPREWDVVVALGARWSAYDDQMIGAWLAGQLKLLRTAHEARVPILGICFGGQALARALDGSVRRAQRPEVGWVQVDTDEPGLIGNGPWFQWHFDEFTPPTGATELARNAAGSQAFRIGRSLGIQFHPEVDRVDPRRLAGRKRGEDRGSGRRQQRPVTSIDRGTDARGTPTGPRVGRRLSRRRVVLARHTY